VPLAARRICPDFRPKLVLDGFQEEVLDFWIGIQKIWICNNP